MKTAIVHDWFTTYAGSERCVESFLKIWNEAEIFGLVDFLSRKNRKFLNGKSVHTSFIQNLPFAKKNHRIYLPIFPVAIESFDFSGFDLVISSSHAVAKGALTNSEQLHICYCHTPMRYAWDLYHQYLKESNLDSGLKGFLVKRTLHKLRIWDSGTANRVDYFIANSQHIAKRIKKIYNRDSEVINPPVDVDNFVCESNKESYYLTISRLVQYKKVNLIVEAFSEMKDKKLIVIGEGPDSKKIKDRATKNIEILGYLDFQRLAEYLRKAKAFVFAAEEDFGIVMVEALACGTPVIALQRGGASEIIENHKNGILFKEQTKESIINAVGEFEKISEKFDSIEISNSAKRFSREIFERKIKDFINKKCDEFFNE